MTKLEQFRQFISPYISGPNADAIINALSDQAQALSDLSVAVTDQLTISTASSEYLEQRLSEVGIVQPTDLGLSDDVLRRLGIAVTANKQIVSVIHEILDVFYGSDCVRANAISTAPEPYVLEDGMDLILSLEDDKPLTVTVYASDFVNISQATAQELASAITKGFRLLGYQAFAVVETDYDDDSRYVKIYGSAMGPYSMVKILGGRLQNILEFPTIRATDIPYGNGTSTAWQITRNVGDTIRFRWHSGASPLIDKILVGDYVMIYGPGFEEAGISGTFEVTDVRLPKNITAYDAGWFEIQYGQSGLRNSTPDTAPPSNDPGQGIYYYYTVNQSNFDDLKFFQPQKNTSYSRRRYALAFEPARKLLKIYLPATTSVIYRDLIGSGHLHMGYSKTTFNGSFGSTTTDTDRIEVVNPYVIRYRQPMADAEGSGGTITYNSNTYEIESISRSGGDVTVITTAPHNITGLREWKYSTVYAVTDIAWHAGLNWIALAGNVNSEPGPANSNWKIVEAAYNLSDVVVAVDVDVVATDSTEHSFLGSYIWDETADYTLTNQIVKSRERIFAGESRRTLLVDGAISERSGDLVFDLGRDSQELPIKFVDIQTQSDAIAVPILSISQNDLQLLVQTQAPHGAIPGSKVTVSGTTNFNGDYVVDSTPSPTIYTATATVSKFLTEATGTTTLLVDDVISTLILDKSYIFKHNHDYGTDITRLSSTTPHKPAEDGSDYQLYVTGTAEGVKFAEQIINSITASGINLEIVILYPSGIGLGNEGNPPNRDIIPHSEVVEIYGV